MTNYNCREKAPAYPDTERNIEKLSYLNLPQIWKYDGTQKVVDSALEHLTIDLNMPEGLLETDILLTGGMNGSLCTRVAFPQKDVEFSPSV
ncbi:hypothetical protein CQW23_01687 [Capsicum baccatum]|uniref:Uncharacterized protein n=1 Tax=Capsicum baccatum TaxID=33114 RepID=A0A2G2XPB4_CAPBA|nr:hypothetical protein CQW23_01687 [Capsicum baccatum]